MFKKLIALVVTMVGIIVLSAANLIVCNYIKGKNYSDTGIAMFQYSQLSFFIGTAAYFILSLLTIYIVQKKIEKDAYLTYIVGLPFMMIYFVLFQWILRWTVNY
ncbi:MAG: hypothetical protein OEZ36_03920 [Spirochaetota bacterium]|nr:hypothetical protein [Spirochaetota bacterium]